MSSDLHRALSAAAHTDAGSPDIDAAWQRAQRQRHQRALGAVAGVLVVAISAAFLLANGSDPRISTPATSELGSILALRGSQLIELSADGVMKREVATFSSIAREAGGLSVSSDGTTALITPLVAHQCANSQTRSGYGLSQVNIETGKQSNVSLPETAGGVDDATLSPDGSRFAYVEYECQPSESPTIDARRPNALVVRDLAGSELFRYAFPLFSPDDGHHLEIIHIAGWEPDGRNLLVQVQHEPTIEVWRVDTQGVVSPTKLPTPVGIPAISITPLGSTGQWLADQSVGSAQASRIVEYDPDTGSVLDVVLQWSGLPVDAGLPHAESDTTGRHLLLIAYPEGHPQVLYRWSAGDAQPTKVADGVAAAAWLPSPANPPPTTTSSTVAPAPGTALGLTVHLPQGWTLQPGTCPAPRTVLVLDAVTPLPVPAGCADVVGPWAVLQRVPTDLDGIDTACGPSYRNGMPSCSAAERDPTTADGYPGTERRFYVGLHVLVSIHRTTTEGPSDDALSFTYTAPVHAQRFPISFDQVVRDTMERILVNGCAGLATDNTATLEQECNTLAIPAGAKFQTIQGSSMGGAVASEYILVSVSSEQGVRRYRLLVEHRWNAAARGLTFYVGSISTFEGPPPPNSCLPSPPQDPRFLGPQGACPT